MAFTCMIFYNAIRYRMFYTRYVTHVMIWLFVQYDMVTDMLISGSDNRDHDLSIMTWNVY